jgi:dihydrofolate reductase
MAKIKLFIASTIDGFIAREDGSLDWLNDLPNPDQLDYGYVDFLESIDVLIMGRKTYEEILNFGIEWPYADKKSFVLSADPNYLTKTPNTILTNRISEDFIKTLRSNSKRNVWIIGGGQLIQEFLEYDAVDKMTLSIIPVILGKGIKLFRENVKERRFELIRSESFTTGVVNLTYKKI